MAREIKVYDNRFEGHNSCAFLRYLVRPSTFPGIWFGDVLPDGFAREDAPLVIAARTMERSRRLYLLPRPDSQFTRDCEDLTAGLTIRADKTTVSEFLRIAWRTVGTICERVCDEYLDGTRFEGLVRMGVDEISWRKHHNYVTLVTNSDTGKVIWGETGKNAAALDKFFEVIGPENTAKISTVSMDMGLAFQKSVREKAPNALICFDPFHVVQLATNALDEVRRRVWREQANQPDKTFTKSLQGLGGRS